MKEWRKVPSVTTGGREFFYQLIEDGKVTRSVVWDRAVSSYAVRDETRIYGGRGMLITYSPTVAHGKQSAER